MIYLIILQIFSAQIDSAITLHHQTDYERAYHLAFSLPVEQTQGLEYYEIQELKAYLSTKLRKYNQADSLFQIAFQTTNTDLLSKAYGNYAELQHMKFNFDKRILYLQMAYDLDPTNQLIRIIAKHHFQIEADYELAESWLDRHTIPKDAKDSSGYFSTLAQLAEAKRQYDQAIQCYTKAKISAQEANLFSYELFASEGLHRSENLQEIKEMEKMKSWLYYVIFIIVFYLFLWKGESWRKKYGTFKSRSR